MQHLSMDIAGRGLEGFDLVWPLMTTIAWRKEMYNGELEFTRVIKGQGNAARLCHGGITTLCKSISLRQQNFECFESEEESLT